MGLLPLLFLCMWQGGFGDSILRERGLEMRKLDLERMLMDPEALKRLTDRASAIREREGEFGRTQGQPASQLRAVEPLAYEVRPTPEEIRANDDDHPPVKRNLLADIGRFFPELEKEDPRRVLSILTDRLSEDPSQAGQFLVEDAINRLVSVGELDGEAQKLVDEAMRTLNSVMHEEGKGKKEDCIWSRLYRHSNYGGRSFFVFHGPGWVYRLVRVSSLSAVNLNDRISSLYTAASAHEAGGEVILFQHDRYVGRYARFGGTPGTTVWTSYVGGFINDRTSSILVARRFNPEKEVSIALGSLGLRDEIAGFAGAVARVSLRGDPIITWDMWPPFSPSRRFIYVRVPVRVDVPNWFDYDAEIRYWIYLYVDGAGALHGYVNWYGAWVEGGILTGKILDRIMDALPGTLGEINTRLSDALSLATLLGPLERQYFLPGTAGSTGHTEDDVTIVLVRR